VLVAETRLLCRKQPVGASKPMSAAEAKSRRYLVAAVTVSGKTKCSSQNWPREEAAPRRPFPR